jgi:hypothetical protein
MSTYMKNVFKRPEYGVWKDLLRLFTDPEHKKYIDYGAKGIEIQKTWLGKKGYIAFINDLGLMPENNCIVERIDKSKGFTKRNCKWKLPIEIAQSKVVKLLSSYNFDTEVRLYITENNITKISAIPGYSSWKNMVSWCYDSDNSYYSEYGGKGIVVLDEWKKSFANFINDMGIKPHVGDVLYRINNTKDFTLDNCIWKYDINYLRDTDGYIRLQLRSL